MGEIIAVDSVVYNLAGEEINRPQILKNLVIQNVLSGTKEGMGESIINGVMKGGGIKLRSFYRWAENPDNYGLVGIPTGSLEVHSSLNTDLVKDVIPHDAEEDVWVQNAFVGQAEIQYWAEQWILANRREDYTAAWTVDFNDTTKLVTINFPTGTPVETFTATDFDYQAQYVYAYYATSLSNQEGELVTGDTIILGVGDPFPDTTGWTQTLNDPGPPIHRVYERETFSTDPDTGNLVILIETMHQFEDGADRSYRIDTQENIHLAYGDLSLYIYRIGSGNAALDALVETAADYGDFFPFIPIRLDNDFLSEENLPDVYEQTKKAYRKATGSRLTKLIEQLEDNEDLDDIDHAYIVFGVSLNVIENTGKKYLYHLFENLQATQAGGPLAYAEWKAAIEVELAKLDPWVEWFNAQNSDPEPDRPSFNRPPSNHIKIKGSGDINSRYDVRMTWNFVTDGSASGLGKPDAKTGDLWIEYVGKDVVPRYVIETDRDGDNLVVSTTDYEKIRIYWQRDSENHTWLEILGAIHTNEVYGGKSVVITAKEALEDPEESGFIVPLHYDTWREMTLIDTTQMATACVFIVFNCYEVYKTKWYESGIFRVLLVIVIAVVSAVFTGGAGFGLLGTNFAVGSALGFSGLTAAIVGSVANALAAMVLVTIVEKAVGQLGVLGPIVSFLLMFVVGSVANAFQTGSLAINWGDLLRVDNLLKLTDAVGRSVAKSFQMDTMAMQQEWLDYSKKIEAETRKIQQAYFEEFGYGGGQIDPWMFTDVNAGPMAESSDTFLTRTLMTGSEIAEMSQELLYEFPAFSLELPDAFT